MHDCDNDRFVGSASVATNTRLRIRMEIVGALTTKGLRRVIETLTQDTLDGHSYSADRGSVKGIWASEPVGGILDRSGRAGEPGPPYRGMTHRV
jgi:hypothetical protein